MQMASTLTDLAGYRVYYGTSAGQYSTTLPAGMATQVVIAGLAEGQTYYITVTAYDTSGNESAPATEVHYTIPTAPGDTTAPTVSGSSVANLATNVDPNTTPTVTFSEAMDASTLNATTVQLRDPSGALIAASVTYNAATKTVSLDPASALSGQYRLYLDDHRRQGSGRQRLGQFLAALYDGVCATPCLSL